MSKVMDTKLVQVFLSQTQTPGPGIYEVSVDDDNKFYCTCPGFQGRNTCKHVKFVTARVKSNGGDNYPLEFSSRATKDDVVKAKQSKEEFRDFVIRFGKIEVF
jgi:hypothetical protein